MKFKVSMLICVSLSLTVSQKTYHGDQVLKVYPETDEQVRVIQELEDTPGLVDFWSPKYAHQVGERSSVDIHIPRVNLVEIKNMLDIHDIQYEVKIQDVQKLLDNQSNDRSKESRAEDYYNEYHNLTEIYDWMEMMASEYPDMVTKTTLGKSYEDREIQILTITKNPDNPSILLDCGFHAREHISPAFCQCFTRNLLEGYGNDPVFTRQLDFLTFHIIPVVNVDGYEYSRTVDRFWRKTRSNYGTTCTGVDPNRNCDADWAGPGSSGNPCSETYYGPFVESEIEVKIVSDFIRQNEKNILAYITVHSYGQMIIYPWAYTFQVPETAETLHKYAEQAAEEILKIFGTSYIYGQTSRVLYRAAGGSDDFAYIRNIPLSYTLELRDEGEFGFALPADQIEPTCIETTAAMKVFADGALEIFFNSK